MAITGTIRRIWSSIRNKVVQEVPSEVALCEFDSGDTARYLRTLSADAPSGPRTRFRE